jgi:DNA-binding MarR family transcriptional regulator
MVKANDPQTDEILTGLFDVLRAMKRTLAGDPAERSLTIVLHQLKEHGGMRLSDLATILCLDVSTTSRHVRALEDRGYIERTGDPADGRAVRLALAPAGDEVLARAWADRRVWMHEALAGWSSDQRRELAAALRHLADSLPTEPNNRTVRQETSA